MNLIKLIRHRRIPWALLCLCMAGALGAADAPAPPAPPAPPQAEQVFALVNGKPVTVREYITLFDATMRQTFYHGTVPEGQDQIVRRQVADLLIERALLVEEAARRGIKPDAGEIKQAVAGYDAQYGSAPMWQQQRELLLPGLTAEIAQQSVLTQLDQTLRKAPEPKPAAVRAYYQRNLKLFTEPEKIRVAVILLKVDPAALRAVWDKAREEAQAISARIKRGANFAEAARLHSADPSAQNGGDLGYLHRGMLEADLEKQIDKFQIGAVSEPLTVLEGVAMFKVTDRIAPELQAFPKVRQRALELLRRDMEAQARQKAISRLQARAKIQILAPEILVPAIPAPVADGK